MRPSIACFGVLVVPLLVLIGLFWADQSTFESIKSQEQISNEKCPVHSEHLRLGTARIVYGYLVFDPGQQEAHDELFPKSLSYLRGGCVMSNDSKPTASVWYCKQCRIKENEWISASSKRMGARP